jgi:ketosteroid isomerase-like protein
MQKIYFLTIVLLLSAIASAQHKKKQREPVQQTVEKMFATLTNADTVALKLFCTADIRFYEYGQIWTIDTLIQKLMQSKSIPDFKRTNSFEFVSTTIKGKTAWVTYYLQSTITRNGKEELIKWMETVVLLKEKKNWKINVLHSTRLTVK